MILTVSIDKAGRVVIPKKNRDELRLAGDSLTIECDGEGLTLQPIDGGAPMRKDHGIWVFHGGAPLYLEEIYQNRARHSRATRLPEWVRGPVKASLTLRFWSRPSTFIC